MFGLGGTMGRIAPVKGIRIRCLTTDLLEQKAEVHARTWRETYSGLLPLELVDAITPAFALKVTRLHDFRMVLLAMDGDAVVGYAEYLNPARPPSTYHGAAEVAALYVLKQYQGCGIGRRLFEEAMRRSQSDCGLDVPRQRPRPRVLRAYGLSSDRADSGCGWHCWGGGRAGEFRYAGWNQRGLRGERREAQGLGMTPMTPDRWRSPSVVDHDVFPGCRSPICRARP